MWVSTLDGRTSAECRARDHLLYTKVDHKPVGHSVPWRAGPGRLHWCCRSTSIALLKGQNSLYGSRAAAGGPVDADLTYNDRLKQQSPTVQDEVLVKTKGDLYRAGKHDASIFTNDKGRTPSLKEMAARDARDFKQPAGELTIYDPGFARVAAGVSTPARAAAVEIEDAIRNEKNEFGAFLVPDGRVLLRRAGEPDRVSSTEDELRGMKGALFTPPRAA
jgi:hypothetical protein